MKLKRFLVHHWVRMVAQCGVPVPTSVFSGFLPGALLSLTFNNRYIMLILHPSTKAIPLYSGYPLLFRNKLNERNEFHCDIYT